MFVLFVIFVMLLLNGITVECKDDLLSRRCVQNVWLIDLIDWLFVITRIPITSILTPKHAWLIAMCHIFKWLEEEIVKRRHGNKTRAVQSRAVTQTYCRITPNHHTTSPSGRDSNLFPLKDSSDTSGRRLSWGGKLVRKLRSRQSLLRVLHFITSGHKSAIWLLLASTLSRLLHNHNSGCIKEGNTT